MIKRFWEELPEEVTSKLTISDIDLEIEACEYDLLAPLPKDEKASIKEEMAFWKQLKKRKKVTHYEICE